jgi:ABC-type uncharacterized transport system auxiliary subunit
MRVRENSVRFNESWARWSGRSWTRWGNAAAVLLLAAGLSSCGSPKPIHYFQLTHPPTTGLSDAQTINATLLVRQFLSPRLYRDDRIVYGDEGVQVGMYENERWTSSPAELLQDALARELRSSGQFRAVTMLRSDASVDYYLMGQLYSFREVTGNNILARLQFDVQLVDLRKSRTIWKHSYMHDEPVAGKTVEDIVNAMDKNVHQAVQEVQDGVVPALSEYMRK